MSMGEVGDGLRRVRDQLARAREQVTAASSALARLQQMLLALTRGSRDPRVGAANARQQAAIQRLEEANAANTAASAAISSYMDELGLENSSLPPQSTSSPTLTSDPARHNELIERARESLSPGILGARTDGKWVTKDGRLEDLSSGKGDVWYEKAKTFAATLPSSLKAASRLAVHLETKFAVRMREEGLLRETIVIDREVCGRSKADRSLPFTCDKQLKRFLPPGAELTVVEYDGTRRTYRGEGSQ